jgi:hypothetical protein
LVYLWLDQNAVNGGPSRGWLEPDEELSLGQYRISAKCVTADKEDVGSPSGHRGDSLPALPHPELVFSYHGRPVIHYPLRRHLALVGQDRVCKLRLHYRRVSKAHCIFYRDADGLWLIDLLSTHGTVLDGKRVEAAPWPVGGVLMLGDVAVTHTLPGLSEQSGKTCPSDERAETEQPTTDSSVDLDSESVPDSPTGGAAAQPTPVSQSPVSLSQQPPCSAATPSCREEVVAPQEKSERQADLGNLSLDVTDRMILFNRSKKARRRWRVLIVGGGLLIFLSIVAVAAVFCR